MQINYNNPPLSPPSNSETISPGKKRKGEKKSLGNISKIRITI
jgi:hypothetical protein